MVENREYVIRKRNLRDIGSLPASVEDMAGSDLLRWFVTEVDDEEIRVEATLCDLTSDGFRSGRVDRQHFPGKSAVLNIIPTGVGCEFGGYAGDSAPVTALLASTVDYLITHPNAVNASNFIYLPDNVVYAEGYLIDLFCKGAVNFHLPYSNKVGLVIEKADDGELDLVFNILNTVRAVHGVDVDKYVITDELIGGTSVRNGSGAYVGHIKNPQALFRACRQLIDQGVHAIAITSNIQELPSEGYADHFFGKHPNPVGGAEAVISHLVSREFKVPAAHAPMINFKEFDLPAGIVDARGAGEMVSASGLACVLIGLRRAPQIQTGTDARIADIINLNNLVAVVAPAGALGGIPMLYAQAYNIPIIAVQDNGTILDVTAQKLGLENVIHVRSYPEAAGVVLALTHGLSVSSLFRPLHSIRYARKRSPARRLEERKDLAVAAEIA